MLLGLRAPMPALLALALAACDPGGSTAVPAEPEEDLRSLSVSPRQLPANGRAVTLVSAVIPASSRVLPRQVTFSTSEGLFLTQQQASRSVTVGVDANGVAVVPLQAPSAPGLVLVSARAGETTLQDTVRIVQAPADLVHFAVGADSLLADDVSTVVVQARIPGGSTLNPLQVTFETTAGAFTQGGGTSVTVKADSTGTALALLRAASEPGTALVRATAGATTLQDTLRFVQAYPQVVVMSADSFRVVANPARPFEVTAHLRRAPGKVSPGAIVTFAATDTVGAPLGWFAGQTEAPVGTVKSTYTPGTTAYRGPVVITASTRGEGGFVVSGRLVVEVSSP